MDSHMKAMIVRPLVAGALNAGVLYAMGRSSGDMMDYLQTSGLQAVSTLSADVVSMMAGWGHDPVGKGIVQMAVEPAVAGLVYGYGANMVFGAPNSQFTNNVMVGAGADLVSSHLLDPVADTLGL